MKRRRGVESTSGAVVNDRPIPDATPRSHTRRLSLSATSAGQNLFDERFRGPNHASFELRVRRLQVLQTGQVSPDHAWEIRHMRDEFHHQAAYRETVFERTAGFSQAIADRPNSLRESPGLRIDDGEPIQLAHLIESERADQPSHHTRGRRIRQTFCAGDCPGSWPGRAQIRVRAAPSKAVKPQATAELLARRSVGLTLQCDHQPLLIPSFGWR
jgi:hypothetical protein